MEAFYKWWKTYKQKWSLNEHYAREGWRAALEWVKNRSDVAKNLYMIDVNELDEELEE